MQLKFNITSESKKFQRRWRKCAEGISGLRFNQPLLSNFSLLVEFSKEKFQSKQSVTRTTVSATPSVMRCAHVIMRKSTVVCSCQIYVYIGNWDWGFVENSSIKFITPFLSCYLSKLNHHLIKDSRVFRLVNLTLES